MFLDPSLPPDPESPGPLSEDEREAARMPVPDSLDLVLDVADMMATFAAQRYQRIDVLRREAQADAARRESTSREIVDRSVRLELAAALRITEYAAGELMGTAEALVHRYPGVLEALYRAQVTEKHAQLLVDAVDQAEPHLRDDILPQALELARTQPVGTFRRKLRQLIDTAQASTLAHRHAQAVQRRRVATEPGPDGMGWIGMYGPDVEVRATFERVTAMAKAILKHEAANPETATGRTLDQARADVFADLLIEGIADAHPESARGIRASVVVTVPVLSLLADGASSDLADPPVVEGVGPIPVETARQLCGGADDWMRVLTHPETGMVLSVGRDQYRAPESLRRLVKWRADRCMAPGCHIPASRCEIDHNIAWAEGGHTCLGNHCPFCKGHHTVKHHAGWKIRQLPDGSIEWTSPTGRRYLVEPERRVPVFRTDPAGEPTAAAPF